jgi:hypothetical protein
MSKEKITIKNNIGRIIVEIKDNSTIADGTCKYCNKKIMLVHIFNKRYLPVSLEDREYIIHSLVCKKTRQTIRIK